MDDLEVYKLISLFALLFGSLLSCAVPWFVVKSCIRNAAFILSVMNCLAGGTILGAALSHMMPDSTESLNTYFGVSDEYPYSPLITGGALLTLIIIDKTLLMKHHSHGGGHGHGHGHGQGKGKGKHVKQHVSAPPQPHSHSAPSLPDDDDDDDDDANAETVDEHEVEQAESSNSGDAHEHALDQSSEQASLLHSRHQHHRKPSTASTSGGSGVGNTAVVVSASNGNGPSRDSFEAVGGRNQAAASTQSSLSGLTRVSTALSTDLSLAEEESLPYDPAAIRNATVSTVTTFVRRAGYNRVRRHSTGSASQVSFLEASSISYGDGFGPSSTQIAQRDASADPRSPSYLQAPQVVSPVGGSGSTYGTMAAPGGIRQRSSTAAQSTKGGQGNGGLYLTIDVSQPSHLPPSETTSIVSKPSSAEHAHASEHDGRSQQALTLRAYLFAAALSVHSLFEGLGMGAETNMEGLLSLIIAVVAHKAIEAFSLGVGVYYARMPLTRAVIILVGYSLVTPIGIAFGMTAAESADGSVRYLIEGILTSVASGSFLYISLIELIPSELQSTAGITPPSLYTSRSVNSKARPLAQGTRISYAAALYIKIFAVSFGWGVMVLIAKWA